MLTNEFKTKIETVNALQILEKQAKKNQEDGIPLVALHTECALKLAQDAQELLIPASTVGTINTNKYALHTFVGDGKTDDGKKPSDKPTTPKSDKAQPKSDFQKYIEAVNARSERERFYALRHEAAQNAADRCKAEANKDKRFKWITGELGRIEFELAQASIYNPSGLAAIKTRKAAYLRERREILCRLGIDEDDLTVEAHCKCRICFDKGFRADGTACDCYTPGVESRDGARKCIDFGVERKNAVEDGDKPSPESEVAE